MSVLDQNGRIQALGSLARWRLTSHALYYKIPYPSSLTSDYVIYGCYLKLLIPFEPIGQMIILPNSVGKIEVPRLQQRTGHHKFPSKLEKRPGKRVILTKHTHCLVSDTRHLLSANLPHLKTLKHYLFLDW